MTDNEIVELLVFSIQTSYDGACHLKQTTASEVLNLITRQKAEIERLNNTFVLARGQGKSVIQLRIDIIKSEAIKEYMERVKAGLIKGGIYPVLVKNTLDRVKEEMVGDSNG